MREWGRYRRLVIVVLGLAGLVLVLAGCDALAPATPTPVPTTTLVPPTPRLPTPPPAPPATLAPDTPTPPDDTPTLVPPSATRTPRVLNQGTPAPTFPPNPPELAALLADSYARMAALPGYTFTATVSISDFGRGIKTRIDGVYTRPDRMRWTTRVNDATTHAIIIGPDYYVSADQLSWTQVPGAEAALAQYRLWATLHDAEGAEVGHDDDPTAPLRHLGYSLTPEHLPLPPQAEPWRLLEAGVWIGRDSHLLYRLDLAAQTANYLLEEHMYFTPLAAAIAIAPPGEETPEPDTNLPPPDITPSEGFPLPLPTNTLIAEP